MQASPERKCDFCGLPLEGNEHPLDPSLCDDCSGRLEALVSPSGHGTHRDAGETLDSDQRSPPPEVGDEVDQTIDSGVLVTPRAEDESSLRQSQSIGRFLIRRNLGYGAFGKVYLAYDPLLDREVALKVPRLPPDEPDLVERFQREAKAAARLRHPNIVMTFECGRVGDDYYIATEFVDGMPLSSKIKKGDFDQRQAATWIRDLADALTYAHCEGIIHRDIKPANIMLSHAGRPELMDFGLAKIQSDNDGMTIDGSVVGTPAYMAPEQARGDLKATGPQSDQYSLGAVFYELLTKQKPFSGSMHTVIMRVAGNEEPEPIRKFVPNISSDLEAICEKALSKDPDHRYGSTAALALDIERWLIGEPIQARRISQFERTWRWCRRNRAVASLLFLVASLLAIGASVSAVSAFRFRSLAQKEHASRIRAERQELEAELRLADMFTFTGLAATREDDPAQAVLWFAHAIDRSNADPIRRQANLVRFNNWTRQTPIAADVVHPGRYVRQMDFDPSGRYLLTLWAREPMHLWDVTQGRPVEATELGGHVNAAAWSPDGKWLAQGLDAAIQINRVDDWGLDAQEELTGLVQCLAFSPDQRWLALGVEDGDQSVVRLWDTIERKLAPAIFVQSADAKQLAFSDGSELLAVSCADGSTRVYDVPPDASGEPRFGPIANVGPFFADAPVTPMFVEDDSALLTFPNARPRSARWWSSVSGETIAEFSLSTAESPVNLNLFAVSPDRRFMLLGSGSGSAAWDIATQTRVGKMMPHTNIMTSVAFHKGGKVLLTGSLDRTARLWEFPSGRPLSPSIKHEAEVHLVAFSPEISTFATCQGNGVVRVWRFLPNSSDDYQRPTTWSDAFLRSSDDGRYVAPATFNSQRAARRVPVIDTATGKDVGGQLKAAGILNAAALSADGSKILGLSSQLTDPRKANSSNSTDSMKSEPGLIQWWDRSSGTELMTPIETPSEPIAGALHPTLPLAAVLCAGGQLLFVNTELGEIQHASHCGGDYRLRYMIRGYLRFTRDGKSLVVWGRDENVTVWDIARLEKRFSIQTFPWATDIIFSQDGGLMVVCSASEQVRIVDLSTGVDAVPPLVHRDWVFSASFSPDENLLITAGRDKTARVWNWRSGSIAAPDMEHDDEVFDVAFVKDRDWVVTTCRDGTVNFWDVQSGKPLAPPLQLDKESFSVVLNHDGQSAVIGGRDRVFVLDVRSFLDDTSTESEARLLLAELIAGRRLLSGGGVANLESSEWQDRWQTLRSSQTLRSLAEPDMP